VSLDLHRRAEELVGKGERAAATGRDDDAKRLYLEAAEIEAEVFRQIPTSRPRTRGIIAVSVVSLLWRARAMDDVRRIAHDYLECAELPEFARFQIGQLAADIDPRAPSDDLPDTEATPHVRTA
jgi:hypothetical protein